MTTRFSIFRRLALVAIFAFQGFAGQSATIILTSDQQLNDLLDPDKKIDLSTGFTKRYGSLRDICEAGQKRGDKILTIAFDEIFRQYREQAGTERLLTPLELGPAFNKQTGQSGQWIHYKTGLRDPESGKFGVQLWQQLYWTNNKGKFAIKLKGARAYAFKEDHIPNTSLELIIHRPNFRAGLQWG